MKREKTTVRIGFDEIAEDVSLLVKVRRAFEAAENPYARHRRRLRAQAPEAVVAGGRAHARLGAGTVGRGGGLGRRHGGGIQADAHACGGGRAEEARRTPRGDRDDSRHIGTVAPSPGRIGPPQGRRSRRQPAGLHGPLLNLQCRKPAATVSGRRSARGGAATGSRRGSWPGCRPCSSGARAGRGATPSASPLLSLCNGPRWPCAPSSPPWPPC